MPSATLRVFGAGATAGVNLDGDTLTRGVDFVMQPAAGGDGSWFVITRAIDAGASISITP